MLSEQRASALIEMEQRPSLHKKPLPWQKEYRRWFRQVIEESCAATDDSSSYCYEKDGTLYLRTGNMKPGVVSAEACARLDRLLRPDTLEL